MLTKKVIFRCTFYGFFLLGGLVSQANFKPVEYPSLDSSYPDTISFAYESFYKTKKDTLGLIYTYGNRLRLFPRDHKGLPEAILFFIENDGIEKRLGDKERFKVRLGMYSFYWGGSRSLVMNAVKEIEKIVEVADTNNWPDLKVEAFVAKYYLLEGKSNAFTYREEIKTFYEKNIAITEKPTVQNFRLNILMGRYAVSKKDFSTAEACFRKATAITEIIGSRSQMLLAKLFLAQTRRLKGNYSGSLQACTAVLDSVKQDTTLQGLDLARWAYEEKAKAYAALGNPKKANESWENYDAKIKAYILASSKLSNVEYSITEQLQSKYKAKKKEDALNKEILNQTRQQNETLRDLTVTLITFGIVTAIGVLLWFYQRKERMERENELLILTKQEEEREHISRELHDYVGNTLIAIKNTLYGSKDYDKVKHLFDEVYQFIRTASHQLSSSAVTELGLVRSCKEYISFIDNNRKIKSYFSPTEHHIGTHKSKAIFRIVQELIQNALKHSLADEIRFSLYFEEGEILIHIEDNGKGFQQSENHSGKGIANIKHRLNLLKGDMKIDANAHAGTSIWVNVPI